VTSIVRWGDPTGTAIRTVEEWTPQEAVYAWYFLCGSDPVIVAKINERVMQQRNQGGMSHASQAAAV
jgi:hypothetical protein